MVRNWGTIEYQLFISGEYTRIVRRMGSHLLKPASEGIRPELMHHDTTRRNARTGLASSLRSSRPWCHKVLRFFLRNMSLLLPKSLNFSE